MKFKQYIQSEINQKEVEPSHDAWDRIQARMENQAPAVVIEKSSKKWWAIAAAVIGLAVCTTVYFSMNNETNVPQIVNESTVPEIKNSSETSPQEHSATEILNQIEEIDNTEMVESKSNPTTSPQTMEVEKEQMVSNLNSESKITEQPQQQSIQKPALASGLKPTPQQIATNLDTVKMKKNKGNYVDPSMLLYSIENKEALKETQKEKTRVAVIDLNK
ncbi:hypothetical protein [Faecalibacter rhinopitheci]|uniref:Uncharacterized protein n=1 Tax=Faecalibacter rhinopitheci TaxID=2779678 RepID=A0A8J7FQH1_9FLAO|nr:hypothetical protein [Faecalibacter rhinopitheci]MBF0597809.1 hypothetical protein [Faecalibacter rhinopitheci]MBQ0147776.1 hypothetical protein [Candidatus Onthonaster equi]